MKRLLILLLIISQSFVCFSQVHVRGYTRKDGTYVRPHTRSYPSGRSSSYSTGGYGNTSDDSQYLTGGRTSADVNGESVSVPTAKFKDGEYRLDSELMLVKPRSYSDDAIPVYEATTDLSMANSFEDSTTVPVYISVIRVNGKVADVAAFPRDILYKKTDFSHTMHHVIKKSLLTAEQALELIDKYGFTSSEGVVKLSMLVGFRSSALKWPSYISHRFEVIRLR